MAQAVRAVVLALLLAATGLLSSGLAAAQPLRTGPTWNDLSQQDRQTLAPLAGEWNRFDALRKDKWLRIARRYPNLPAAEQRRIQERMQGWARLSSKERQAAREQFKGLKTLPPDQRDSLQRKWAEYQALPPEQRQELRKAPPAPRPGPGSTARPPPGGPAK